MTIDSPDPVLAITQTTLICEKTCGSKKCWKAVKLKKCPGIPSNRCVAILEKTPGKKNIIADVLTYGIDNLCWITMEDGDAHDDFFRGSSVAEPYFINGILLSEIAR